MPLHEIVVSSKDPANDPLGHEVASEAQRTLGLELGQVTTAKVYRVEGITDEEARTLTDRLFVDPVIETYVRQSLIDDHNYVHAIDVAGVDDSEAVSRVIQVVAEVAGTDNGIEIAYKRGVMNPEVESITKAAHDLGIHPEAVDSSRRYVFSSAVQPAQIDQVVHRLLMNKTVEEVVIEPPTTLKFEGRVGPVNMVPLRGASTEQLRALSKDKLFLDDAEMKVVQDHFGEQQRDPTDVEVETVAAWWSEHCGHKTFHAKVLVDGKEKAPYIDRIVGAATANFGDRVVSAFGDNSGVIKFYDGWAICGKVETHNSPSAIEPYGGAMTGSGGVFRDIMGTGQGAKTIISTDMFCFAPPKLFAPHININYFVDPIVLPPGTHPPDYLQRRVVDGVRDYGNRMGIPTGNGSVHYHKDFRAKPTVMVGAFGILPESRAQKGEPLVGDLVVVLGGRTGRDGIHGATFSSGEMTDQTAEVNSSAVQIGNAIEEKRTFDALLEARDLDLIRALTDCGAAGFCSAIGEIGEGIGVTVDISKAPVKYPGLAPWEIWLSESQERMVAAVSLENIDDFLAVCEKYNVEAAVLGEFDGSHTLTINYGEQNVAELDYEFLKHGLPQRVMTAHWEPELIPEVRPEAPATDQEWIDRLKAVLAHGNVCSKEPIVRQYDHGVQGGNIVSPFGGVDQSGPNDALVIRPLLGKPYGVVQSHGMNPILNRVDPYEGTVWAIAEAAANYVSVGGNLQEAAAVGNYVWPYPDEEGMGSLDRSVDAAVDMMHLLKLPVISGKDSLSSTYRGKDGEVIKIPPVYTMSIFGRIPDVEKTITSDIKKPGDSVLILVGAASEGMGGSTYYDVTGGSSAALPTVDQAVLPVVLERMQTAIQTGEVMSCHDISEGGLATAIAEMCFGGNSGAVINLPYVNDRKESFLFSETAGCFVVELSDYQAAYRLFQGVPYTIVGHTITDKVIRGADYRSGDVFAVLLDELKTAWQAPMKESFHS